jgi:hypothetical protein
MTFFEVAKEPFGRVIAEDALETPKAKLEARVVRQQVGGEKIR